MKHYAIRIDEHTTRILLAQECPKDGVELIREPAADEILRVENGECVYEKIPREPERETLEQRVARLEKELKELQK